MYLLFNHDIVNWCSLPSIQHTSGLAKLGNIVAEADVSQSSRAGNMLRKQNLLLGNKKMFLPQVKNIFASRTQILLLCFPV